MHSLLAVVSDIFQKKKSARPIIVALLADERDCAVLADVGRSSDWDMSFANTCSEALGLMDRVKAPILFIDRDLAGSDWREAMSRFASLSSRTCIVLVSRVVDVYLWNEVVRYGGYEVLAKPLRRDDVSRAVRLAWFYWSTAARSSAAAKPFARR